MSSSNVTPPFSTPLSKYTLRDLLLQLRGEIMVDLNCHHVGVIQSFDSSTQFVTASVGYQKTNYYTDPVTGNYVQQGESYATVHGPAVILSGGTSYLNMPIAQGDPCLILFNDRDFDTWYQSQLSQPPTQVPTGRLHAFSDALILVGIRPASAVFSSYDNTRAIITDGNASAGINPSNHKVTLKNSAQGTLGTLIQNLITAIQAITVTCPTGGGPSSVPINAATFTTIANDLQGLLE